MGLDFLDVHVKTIGKSYHMYPEFLIGKSKDLMIRGGDFYAIYDESTGLWSTDEFKAISMIDAYLKEKRPEIEEKYNTSVHPHYMRTSSSGSIDLWRKYVKKQMADEYKQLDNQLVFSNETPTRETYASKKLSYSLTEMETPCWDELVSILYSPEERMKIEWAIGSVVSGDSKEIQKFIVFYGSSGTGKSTIMRVIGKLFEGYTGTFKSKELASKNSTFALESLKDNPLVGIEDDGDLSRVEDNSILNSLISHEDLPINTKFKSIYTTRFTTMLFMGTNEPVTITNARAGLNRRLLDIRPTGKTIPEKRYKSLMKNICSFELGGIANHCLKVYEDNKDIYDHYTPKEMLGATNDLYDFMNENADIFLSNEYIALKTVWPLYDQYCLESAVPYKMKKTRFKEELKEYFDSFDEQLVTSDGKHLRNVYSGLKTEKLSDKLFIFSGDRKNPEEEIPENVSNDWIDLKEQDSLLDIFLKDCPAQYSTEDEHKRPFKAWDDVHSSLCNLNTKRLHYVRVPENLIVIDFDLKDESGNKSLELNLKAANEFPKTYAELSQGGQGLHLHYIWKGDVDTLSKLYAEDIEIKVYKGKSSLRRRLTKCNDIPVAELSSGLPIKETKKMVNFDTIKSEKGIRTLILNNLNKQYHPGTKPSVDFIYKILDDAYGSGLKYDVSDLRNQILVFASSSTHQAEYCVDLVSKMKFKSNDLDDSKDAEKDILVFFDCEVFPNLFLINWKVQGKGNPVIRMINPTPDEVEELLKYNLVGYNCRRYDNHILYARAFLGYSNEQLFHLSQRIVVEKDRAAFFGNAYNISYTDVYDFASAGNKMSLKKWEIKLGIHHQELGYKWDEPVPEDKWCEVAEYCDNDVLSTEAVFDELQSDWIARQILADIAGGSVNDTTNQLTTKLIFGSNKNPQAQFNYRNLGCGIIEEGEHAGDHCFFYDDAFRFLCKTDGEDLPDICPGYDKPFFPGYEFKNGKSTYRGEEIGEGGYVYYEPGMYGNVAVLDIMNMHGETINQEQLFGPVYTPIYQSLREARNDIKHGEYDKLKTLFDGKLTKYLTDKSNAKNLSNALKTAINSVYGLTAAKFPNAFKDKRNIDNIVAKRGELFMIDLKHAVKTLGFTVAHIKTDSIKIPDATPDIIQFVMEFGQLYGYTFEHESTYEKMCLVNGSTYIAKYLSQDKCNDIYGYVPEKNEKNPSKWTATAAQFQEPYVFKTLFSREPLTFDDYCQVKETKGSLYLDFNENLPEGEHNYMFIGRIGSFVPVTPGRCGGELLRFDKDPNGDDKFYAAPGTKGYRWMDSEVVRGYMADSSFDFLKLLDKSYYDNIISEALESLALYCDTDWFRSDDPYIGCKFEEGHIMQHPVYNEELPFDPDEFTAMNKPITA